MGGILIDTYHKNLSLGWKFIKVGPFRQKTKTSLNGPTPTVRKPSPMIRTVWSSPCLLVSRLPFKQAHSVFATAKAAEVEIVFVEQL
mgnify:CR=1|jgi:hypothetical protein